MQVCDDVVDLVAAQSSVKRRHRALAVDNDLTDRFVRCRSSAIGKIVVRKKPMQLGWRFDQAELIFFMTVVAIECVERPAALLRCAELFGRASRYD